MNESALNALINLFAIFSTKGGKNYEEAKGILQEYLIIRLGIRNPEEYLSLFYEIFDLYSFDASLLTNEKTQELVTRICTQVKSKIHQSDQVIILLHFLELAMDDLIEMDESLYKTAADIFEIEERDFKLFKTFIFCENPEDLNEKGFLLVNNQPDSKSENLLHLQKDDLNGNLLVFHLPESKQFLFKYYGTDALLYEGQSIRKNHFYIFNQGGIIRGQLKTNIYYTEVAGIFFDYQSSNPLVFVSDHVTYHFPKTKNGLQEFTFAEKSGQLIAVMGGSGVGKSTLLNILNGTIKPQTGSIRINQFDIHENYDEIEGLIGYIPQDDLVIEELTVYQNVFFNAQLCLNNLSVSEIDKQVNNILKDLDLYEIRDMVVGDPIKKTLSGGQRKRLNTALELIREPAILFVDEPTSGLSSKDSEKIMVLLKQQAQQGRLVIVNIHQPSSFIYKLFDKLWIMDKGGYPIYAGNPIDAIVYFKEIANHIDADSCECSACGNVNPEQVLEIVENQRFDESGKLSQERVFTPEEFYTIYDKKIQQKVDPNQAIPSSELDSRFAKPSRLKQFGIFFKRNFTAKLSNRQYMILNLVQAPVLALVVGFLTKYRVDEGYFFGLNKNFPSFIFMSIVVMLFLGMSLSAEEIIRDRFILKRESFLRLSRLSYLNSKIVFLLIVSLIQSFLFVLVSYWILDIGDLMFRYWMILFVTAVFANLAGLNISAGLDSVVAIYISIPMLIIPQILLCGLIVPFDDIQSKSAKTNVVPIIGDVMVSRWAFEALAVDQFVYNDYTKNYFDIEREMAEYLMKGEVIIPELKAMIGEVSYNLATELKEKETKNSLRIIQSEMKDLESDSLASAFPKVGAFTEKDYTRAIGDEALVYLEDLRGLYKKLYSSAENYKDNLTSDLIDSLGKEELISLKKNHENDALRSLLMNESVRDFVRHANGKLQIRRGPVFQEAQTRIGRAHFYAAEKKVGNYYIPTFTFNILAILLMSLVLYISLYYNWLRKIIESVGNLKKILIKK